MFSFSAKSKERKVGHLSCYSPSPTAINQGTQSLELESAPLSVEPNAVAPGGRQ